MKKLSLTALPLLFACLQPPPGPTPPEPEPGPRVRISTFNVHRFFDTVCDSGDCGEGAFEALPSQAQFDARADELILAIEALDADVILLQEIESQACLDALLSRSEGRLNGQLGEVGFAGSLDVAVLARVQMLGVQGYRPTLQLADGRTSVFSRALLEARFVIEGAPVIVFVAHFRSKVNDDPLRRLAEAEFSAELALLRAAELPEALVVFGGDLNDTPGSPPLDALEERGLVRVAAELGAGAATFIFQGAPQAIDHLMLVPGAGGEYVAGSASVIEPGGAGYASSDHSALLADFQLASPE